MFSDRGLGFFTTAPLPSFTFFLSTSISDVLAEFVVRVFGSRFGLFTAAPPPARRIDEDSQG